ncbi:MAG: Kelch repeat-containing protein [Flammeovirgaceae bacterium]
MEQCQFGGDNPQARFGHTITPISKDKALLFGGAVGDNGNYDLIKVDTI